MERTRKSMMGLGLGRKVSLGAKHDGDEGREGEVEMGMGMDTPLRGRRTASGFLSVDGDIPEGVKTPKEDLFSEDVEYDRVFRSRPRIATSPVFGTPAVGGRVGIPRKREEMRGGVEEEEEEEFDEGVTGVDLGDVDMEDEDEGEVESPSRRAWR